MQLLNQVMVATESFYITVHVISFVTAIGLHLCFYLLNKIFEPVFFFLCLAGLNVMHPEWSGMSNLKILLLSSSSQDFT